MLGRRGWRAFCARQAWDAQSCAARLSPAQRERVKALCKGYWRLDCLEQAYAHKLIAAEMPEDAFGFIVIDKNVGQFLREREVSRRQP